MNTSIFSVVGKLEMPKDVKTSKVIEITPIDEKWGIILANMDELENALMVHDQGLVRESSTTKERGANDIIQDHGVPWLGSATEKGFLKKILDKAKPELEAHGKYNQFFEYRAMGTNFFKTGVEIEKIGKGYVLGINAAWVGRDPENALAKYLNKPIALRRSKASIKMGAINETYFNIDFENLFKNTYIPSGHIKKCIDTCFGERRWLEPLSVRYNGVKFKLDIDFRCAYGDIIANENRLSSLIHDNEGKEILPTVTLKLTGPRKGPCIMYPPVVKPEKMQLMQQARDDLIERIQAEK